jgi:hypothetical protein
MKRPSTDLFFGYLWLTEELGQEIVVAYFRVYIILARVWKIPTKNVSLFSDIRTWDLIWNRYKGKIVPVLN